LHALWIEDGLALLEVVVEVDHHREDALLVIVADEGGVDVLGKLLARTTFIP